MTQPLGELSQLDRIEAKLDSIKGFTDMLGNMAAAQMGGGVKGRIAEKALPVSPAVSAALANLR